MQHLDFEIRLYPLASYHKYHSTPAPRRSLTLVNHHDHFSIDPCSSCPFARQELLSSSSSSSSSSAFSSSSRSFSSLSDDSDSSTSDNSGSSRLSSLAELQAQSHVEADAQRSSEMHSRRRRFGPVSGKSSHNWRGPSSSSLDSDGSSSSGSSSSKLSRSSYSSSSVFSSSEGQRLHDFNFGGSMHIDCQPHYTHSYTMAGGKCFAVTCSVDLLTLIIGEPKLANGSSSGGSSDSDSGSSHSSSSLLQLLDHPDSSSGSSSSSSSSASGSSSSQQPSFLAPGYCVSDEPVCFSPFLGSGSSRSRDSHSASSSSSSSHLASSSGTDSSSSSHSSGRNSHSGSHTASAAHSAGPSHPCQGTLCCCDRLLHRLRTLAHSYHALQVVCLSQPAKAHMDALGKPNAAFWRRSWLALSTQDPPRRHHLHRLCRDRQQLHLTLTPQTQSLETPFHPFHVHIDMINILICDEQIRTNKERKETRRLETTAETRKSNYG